MSKRSLHRDGPNPGVPGAGNGDAVEAWARSGARSLTGPADGPGLGPPAPLVERLGAIAGRLGASTERLGRGVDVDPLVLLTERAAIAGLRRRGQTSCGGASRLLRTADGWLAVSLARPDDVDLVPAWLELREVPAAPWTVIEPTVAGRATAALVQRARLLGLPAAGLPTSPAQLTLDAVLDLPVQAQHLADAPATTDLSGVFVVDLGALWAGPLCASLLADAGADVVKVESTTRPDGARSGPAAMFDLLNAGKRSVALPVATEAGRRALRRLVAAADVVIEASRPRALAQLGIDVDALAQADGPRVWVSITAHGRTGPGADRVGFGDDAAVGGGLVAWADGEPCFCADAVADPSSGLVAAAGVVAALAAGGRWLVDVSMAGVAAHLAGPTMDVPDRVGTAAPMRRPPRGAAPPIGSHTREVLDDLERRS